jgi:hypothetical protein
MILSVSCLDSVEWILLRGGGKAPLGSLKHLYALRVNGLVGPEKVIHLAKFEVSFNLLFMTQQSGRFILLDLTQLTYQL